MARFILAALFALALTGAEAATRIKDIAADPRRSRKASRPRGASRTGLS